MWVFPITRLLLSVFVVFSTCLCCFSVPQCTPVFSTCHRLLHTFWEQILTQDSSQRDDVGSRAQRHGKCVIPFQHGSGARCWDGDVSRRGRRAGSSGLVGQESFCAVRRVWSRETGGSTDRSCDDESVPSCWRWFRRTAGHVWSRAFVAQRCMEGPGFAPWCGFPSSTECTLNRDTRDRWDRQWRCWLGGHWWFAGWAHGESWAGDRSSWGWQGNFQEDTSQRIVEQTDEYSLTQARYDETLCEIKSMLIQDEWKKESIKKVNESAQESCMEAGSGALCTERETSGSLDQPGFRNSCQTGTSNRRHKREAKSTAGKAHLVETGWKDETDGDLGRKRKMEKRAREALEIRKAAVHVVHQGRSLDWEDVVELEEGRTVELIVTMKGRTRNRKKKKNKNRWNSDRWGWEERDWMIGIGGELGGRGVQDDLHSGTGQCDGEGERGWRTDERNRREGGGDGRDWAGKRRRIFQEWIGPDDTFDFEKHREKTFGTIGQ